ncbi:DUF4357 domain-containing protein [Saccharomonospora xinjiangensis]
MKFTEDVVCNSPSAEAEVVIGRSTNGCTEWLRSSSAPEGRCHPA